MKIKTNLSRAELVEKIESVGFRNDKTHNGYRLNVGQRSKSGQQSIHVVFTSDGIDVHKDSAKHHVINGVEARKWFEILREML